jgi:phosphoenolpyruvate synthase/pyruvate phosphate dikinase
VRPSPSRLLRRRDVELIPLQSEAATNPKLAGGKAASLARMLRAGLAVPSGYVIPAWEFDRMLDRLDLREVVSRLGTTDTRERSAILEKLRRATEDVKLGSADAEAIASAAAQVGPVVAVRSSGVAEDGDESSFAGAYTTQLGRAGRQEVLDAVVKCWASAFSESVATYRSAHVLANVSWTMAVLIQKMVVAEKAGVMFTRDPFGDGSSMLIEAVSGGCERIVAGAPAELSLWIDRVTGAVVNSISSAPPAQFGTRSGALLSRVPPRRPSLLGRGEREMLVDAARLIELELGAAQDIEWALVRSQLVILQARPLTAKVDWAGGPPKLPAFATGQ